MSRTTTLTHAALAAGLTALGTLTAAPTAHAQASSFPDVSANHWAYQAVQDLAAKGYVKGYPDGRFLGGRAMTRYEFATVIDRIVQTVNDLSTKVSAGAPPPETPAGVPVTQDDLNRINALVDTFRAQLDAIQSQINGDPAKGTKGFQDQINALRQEVVDTKAQLAKATDAANGSYGVGSSRKFQISGFIQSRFVGGPRSKDRFPQGASALSGGYNGNYSQGGNSDSFELRRARLRFTGAITSNTKYGVQIDTSGAITAGATPNQQVTAREGFIAYTFGDGSAKYPTLTAGLFSNPYGYELSTSPALILTPERPLAFSEAGYGLFPNQDFDKGVQITYGVAPGGLPLKLTAALVNGAGRTGEEVNRRIDQIYRAAYQSTNKQLGVGVSYYDGEIDTPGTITGALGTGPAYVGRKRQLIGADAQITLPTGPFVLAEYINGTYEQRTAFPTFAALAPTTVYAPGNKVAGYYAQGGYTFTPAGSHPLSLYVSYDILKRANGGLGSNDAYDDENTGYGASYALDKATRLRVYYVKPSKVAHTPGTVAPPKIGQSLAELQVRF